MARPDPEMLSTMKEAKQTQADVYMYEKHTRTLTSTPRTLLKPSDSETGNGERFAVWARVDYTQSYVELLYASLAVHAAWASALLFQASSSDWCRLHAAPCHFASTSPQEAVADKKSITDNNQPSIPLSLSSAPPCLHR